MHVISKMLPHSPAATAAAAAIQRLGEGQDRGRGRAGGREGREGGRDRDRDRKDSDSDRDTETETATATETEERASELRQYRYREGRGICFGDGFMHATQTGHAPRPLAFLCFTFGVGALTDAEWKGAESYISHQGPIYQDPGGKLVQSAEFPA